MKIQRILSSIAALSLGSATLASADTQYHFSGQACQPQNATEAAKLQTFGLGITNTSTEAYSNAVAFCPVTGLESTAIDMTGTGLKVHVRNFVEGYWEMDNQTFGNIYWSSNKASGGTGSINLTWTAGELYGSTATNYSSYSFRATIGGRCNDVDCYSENSFLQAYWVTHTQP